MHGLFVFILADTTIFFPAEASQMLARNVNYEIPALKRQIEKCDKAQQVSTHHVQL